MFINWSLPFRTQLYIQLDHHPLCFGFPPNLPMYTEKCILPTHISDYFSRTIAQYTLHDSNLFLDTTLGQGFHKQALHVCQTTLPNRLRISVNDENSVCFT